MIKILKSRGFWIGSTIFCLFGAIVSIVTPSLGISACLFYMLTSAVSYFIYKQLNDEKNFILESYNKLNSYYNEFCLKIEDKFIKIFHIKKRSELNGNQKENISQNLDDLEVCENIDLNEEKAEDCIENNTMHPLDKEYRNLKDGVAFEKFCGKLLKSNGYTDVVLTPPTNDYGVDILANKEGVKYAVQCKFYSSVLSNSPVQEVKAGISYYGCHVGVVLTNSSFTKNAKELAEKTNILLWDGKKLNELIEKAKTTD